MNLLEGIIQPYAWGSTTAIADFIGSEVTGAPQAELWFGAHPSAPSRYGGRPLDEVIEADPDGSVGPASAAEYGPRLPYLLKVLAAAQPLSLQAHPSRMQAEAGYARENAAGIPLDAPHRTYKDSWPKPEALCALTDVEALCGFREPAQTYALFEELGVASAFDLVAPLRDGDEQALREVFERLLRLTDAATVDDVVAAARRVVSDGELGKFALTATELAEFYPRDPGILAALLMNRVAYARNQAVFMPAGNLHAYLRGVGVEVMANSDNVLRGGLTPKHIDIDALLEVLDFTPGPPMVIEPVEHRPGVFAYPTPAPEFALWRLECGGPVELPGHGTGRVVLTVAGEVALRSGEHQLTLRQGQAAFVMAADPAAEITGQGTLLVAAPGVEGAEQAVVGDSVSARVRSRVS